MSKTLYVDVLSEDGDMAIATDYTSVRYNLALLGRFNSESNPLFTAGVYLCFLEINKDEKPEMYLFDYTKGQMNLDLFLDKSPLYKHNRYKIDEALANLAVSYEARQDGVTLVKSPVPDNKIGK